MIAIDDKYGISDILFLSDMYRAVLPLHGDILHIGFEDQHRPWTYELWESLRDIFEPNPGTARRIVMIGTHEEENPTVENLDGIITIRSKSMHGGVEAYLDSTSPRFPISLVYIDDVQDYDEVSGCIETISHYLMSGTILALSQAPRSGSSQTLVMASTLGLSSLSFQRWHFSRFDCYAIL